MLIAIYLDDILIACRNQKLIVEFGQTLSKEFEIKNLGDANYCLSVEFCQRNGQITMNQRGYIMDLLQRFNMTECRPVTTPMDTGMKLKKNESSSEEDMKLPYRELIGALTYLSTTTRPDIAFTVSYLGQLLWS